LTLSNQRSRENRSRTSAGIICPRSTIEPGSNPSVPNSSVAAWNVGPYFFLTDLVKYCPRVIPGVGRDDARRFIAKYSERRPARFICRDVDYRGPGRPNRCICGRRAEPLVARTARTIARKASNAATKDARSCSSGCNQTPGSEKKLISTFFVLQSFPASKRRGALHGSI